ncbi:MAG: type 1 glutamine amidotransferase domain-containing protein [Pseudobacteriovorax sp.]|nr:type 1 glutamine amidotransferase domain-containing protein [Pseudobacteriovorax sp.]
MKSLIIFVTNHAFLGETKDPNGTYAPELTHALKEFDEANVSYDIASIKGGESPLYGTDIDSDETNKSYLADPKFQEKIKHTIKAEDVDASTYDGVFYPGGFGLLTDLASNPIVAKITAEIFQRNKPVGSVCHGPGALLPIVLDNGESILENKTVTGFTREEEVDFGSIDAIPYLLEESLTRKAGKYVKIKPWGEHVICDGNLITGQNPASAAAVGKEIIKRL